MRPWNAERDKRPGAIVKESGGSTLVREQVKDARTSTDVPQPGALRPVESITPPQILAELQGGVLGQDSALRFVSVAIYKHTTGKVPGNIILIGNSGTGKTTIMNNIQRLYNELPEYHPFRSMAIINANLLVDSDRLEFRPDRLLTAVEQRARTVLGRIPTGPELKESMERATVCIDEIDKMSSVLAGKPNPIGVALQQGLLTLMEGNVVPIHTHVMEDGQEKPVTLEIDTKGMMFICGGAFEGLYDQVFSRVTNPGSGESLRSVAVRNADGKVTIETRFSLADYFKIEDLFAYGMVPQFIARLDNVVLLSDLGADALKQILLKALDSPFVRSRNYLGVMNITLEIEDRAATIIAEQAERHSRTGARALRAIFSKIVNPIEFDPTSVAALADVGDGRRKLLITAAMVRQGLGLV
jgi:ATP-dependent Clp protease ATP-binding subunit ClpX